VAGVLIIALAYYNFAQLRSTVVPGRVKRIAKSTLQLSVLVAILGVLLLPRFGETWVIPLINVSIYGLILLVHVVNAFAVITQTAAVAIAYDMWEDKEFAKETAPGEIPAMPTPKPAVASPKT
jgi:ABC-type transport system involved in multi-copper enzyme maturation permease subunit